MKHFICLFFLSISVNIVIAQQKVDFTGDTVLVDGKPYCLMIASGAKLNPSFNIQTLEGDELMLFDMPQGLNPNGGSTPYIVTFVGYEEYTARIMPTIPLKKSLIKSVLKYRLISNENELDENAIIRFCKVNYGDYTTLPNSNQNTEVSYISGEYPIVERNTSEKLTCASGNIRQDKKLVGKYRFETRSVKGLAENVVQFFSINNIKIAEAKYFTGSKDLNLLIYKDNRQEKMELTNTQKTIDEVVTYLVDMGYL